MLSVPSLLINDDIMTPLLLLKIINVLADFMILSDSLIFWYLSLHDYFMMKFGFCQ